MSTKTPKGTRDLGPQDVLLRESMFNILKKCFEIRGGLPIDTPTIEVYKVIEEMYGEEFNKLVYTLDEKTREPLYLRYDLTVPFMRWIKGNKIGNFRRYCMGKVWRRDKPNVSNGRFREFYQCDFDIVGESSNMIHETEILDLLVDGLTRIVGNNFTVSLNHKEIIYSVLQYCKVTDDKFKTMSASLDKFYKIGFDEMAKEMKEKGMSDESVKLLQELTNKISTVKGPFDILLVLKEMKVINGLLFNEMELLLNNLKDINVLDKFILDPMLSRGLDYYTGIIYEAGYNNKTVMSSSIASGGRYDNMFGKKKAIGLSFGIERLCCIKKDIVNVTKPTVFVASVGKGISCYRVKICAMLRRKGIFAMTFSNSNPKMRSQLDYVFENKVKYMIVVGENEIKKGTVKFKDIEKHKETEITLDEAIESIVI